MIESSAIGLLGTGLSLFSSANRAATDPSAGANSFIATLFNTRVDPPQSFAEIARRFDVTSLSPGEIEELDATLKASGIVNDDMGFQPRAKAAAFRYGTPESDPSFEKSTAKNDLLAEWQAKLSDAQNSGEPTQTIAAQIALLTSLDTAHRSSVPAGLSPATNSRLSSDTMRTLIAMQG